MPTLTRRSAIGIAAALFVGPAAAQAREPRVPEVDGARRYPALVNVRAAVLAAVTAKDIDRIRPHLAPRILIAFGGENGPAPFAALLRENPALWDELGWILAHGGRVFDGEFWAPYTFQANVGTMDVYEAGIVVADAAPARTEPRLDAPLLATLGRVAVRVTAWGDPEKTAKPFYRRTDWLPVELANKRRAWVEARHLRAMNDYRAGFARIDGIWKLSAFVRGD